jgi:hypothetical protein
MKLLSLSEVANRTGQSHSNACYHAKCGNLPAQQIGGVWVVREDDARSFAQEYGREWHEPDQG